MAISLRIPGDIKARASDLVAKSGSTPHAFMVDAIRETVEAEEALLAFLDEAETRLAQMKAAGAGVPAAEAFAYFDARAGGAKPRKSRARKRIGRIGSDPRKTLIPLDLLSADGRSHRIRSQLQHRCSDCKPAVVFIP